MVIGWLLLVKLDDFSVCVALSRARELALRLSEHKAFVEDHLVEGRCVSSFKGTSQKILLTNQML